MAELTLCRSIILDSGEIVPAGTILKDYGDLTSRSIAPSQAPLIEELRSKPQKDILKKFESKHIIDFFRIPRECVSQASTSGSLKKKWVKGDERVAPFPCFVRATKMCEERSIELIDTKEPFGPHKKRFFDRNFGEIIVFTISSLGNLTIGSQWRLGDLKSIRKLLEHISSYATVIGYYYPNTDYIKVEHLLRRKFYIELRAYQYERTFNELSVGKFYRCYNLCDGNAIFKGYISILGRGDNKWYESFRQTHSWLTKDDYQVTKGDEHIFVRFIYYKGNNEVSWLAVIHNSSNPFLFFSVKHQKVLIKDTCKYY